MNISIRITIALYYAISLSACYATLNNDEAKFLRSQKRPFSYLVLPRDDRREDVRDRKRKKISGQTRTNTPRHESFTTRHATPKQTNLITYRQAATQNLAKEIENLDIQAKSEDASTQYQLGIKLQYGKGVPRNLLQAIALYACAANQDYAPAQNQLGMMYYLGQGVSKDFQLALKWFNLAAYHNYAPAQTNLGMMWHNGQGVSRDFEKALECYMLAAQQNYVPAHACIGMMYYLGQGVSQDFAQAFNWYMRAAKQNHAPAQNQLGAMYYRGQGVSRNFQKSLSFYISAASQGDSCAKVNLAAIFSRQLDAPLFDALSTQDELDIANLLSLLNSLELTHRVAIEINNNSSKSSHYIARVSNMTLSLISSYKGIIANIKAPGFLINCIKLKEKNDDNSALRTSFLPDLLLMPVATRLPVDASCLNVLYAPSLAQILEDLLRNTSEALQLLDSWQGEESLAELGLTILELENQHDLRSYLLSLLEPSFEALDISTKKSKWQAAVACLKGHQLYLQDYMDLAKNLNSIIMDVLQRTQGYRNLIFTQQNPWISCLKSSDSGS